METGLADLGDVVASADEPMSATRDTRAQRMGHQPDSPPSVEFIENTPPPEMDEDQSVTERQRHVDSISDGLVDPLPIDHEVRCMTAL